MNKLQNTILMIADEIKRICEKHEIKYYIVAGTLLGAVRHQGFIPWDDDLDIIMTRLDFERFIQICQIELDSSKFYLQCGGNEEYYAFEFAKIQLKGTKIIEDFNWNVPIQNGIFVDIFPLDNLPDNYIKREILKAKNYILKNLIWIKCGYGVRTHGNFWWYRLGKGVCRLFSLKWLKKKRYQVITKYKDVNTKESFVGDYPRKENYQNSWFEKYRMYDFENNQFMGIEEYDKSLIMLYGSNYMELPPENERKGHTKYEIDYGPYSE